VGGKGRKYAQMGGSPLPFEETLLTIQPSRFILDGGHAMGDH
jgi:hypothetical protein